MAKIKFTKGELKKQRDALSQFRHYLPTLQLKKQQLQMKIAEAKNAIKAIESELSILMTTVNGWSALLSDKTVDMSQWLIIKDVSTERVNIAGASVPIFKNLEFEPAEYDLYTTPFWVDKGIEQLRKMIELTMQVRILQEQIDILAKELRITTQRVNLFEKIKIPECSDNIRRIRIYLGDQQANAVGIGKVAKGKIEARDSQEVLV